MACYTIFMSRILFCGILCAGFLVAQPLHAYTFTRSLYFGSVGVDVRELQKVLNSNPDTHIAVSGAGSPGNETMTFGKLTRLAVMKFQEKYPVDILQPAGLAFGNGFVGPLTLKKLNGLQNTALNNVYIAPGPADPLVNFKVRDNEKIDIYSADKKIEAVQNNIIAKINAAILAGKAPEGPVITQEDMTLPSQILLMSPLQITSGAVGTTIHIQVDEFNGFNDVYFGEKYIIRGISATSGLITVKVPPLPPGRYDIAVKNSKGLSNTTFFVVITGVAAPVQITSVSPKVSYGQSMTIIGSGFAKNNDIITSVGVFKNTPSLDGSTITLPMAPEYLRQISKSSIPGTEQLSSIQVVNDNGVSSLKTFILVLK